MSFYTSTTTMKHTCLTLAYLKYAKSMLKNFTLLLSAEFKHGSDTLSAIGAGDQSNERRNGESKYANAPHAVAFLQCYRKVVKLVPRDLIGLLYTAERHEERR